MFPSVLKYHLEFTFTRQRRTSSHDPCRCATIYALALYTSRASGHITRTEYLAFRTLLVFLLHGLHRLPTEEAVPNAGSTPLAFVIYGFTTRLFTSHLFDVTPKSVALHFWSPDLEVKVTWLSTSCLTRCLVMALQQGALLLLFRLTFLTLNNGLYR